MLEVPPYAIEYIFLMLKNHSLILILRYTLNHDNRYRSIPLSRLLRFYFFTHSSLAQFVVSHFALFKTYSILYVVFIIMCTIHTSVHPVILYLYIIYYTVYSIRIRERHVHGIYIVYITYNFLYTCYIHLLYIYIDKNIPCHIKLTLHTYVFSTPKSNLFCNPSKYALWKIFYNVYYV